jgi:esterase FrsA
MQLKTLFPKGKDTLMLKYILAATTALSMSLAPAVLAQEVDGTRFRHIEEGTWYHPVEPENWVYAGGKMEEIVAVLTRIEQAKGKRSNPEQPDTLIAYGPGNWIYEFNAAGDAAMARGDYAAAVAYYHVASAPHTNDANARAALAKAGKAYQAAAEKLPGRIGALELSLNGATFEAFLHVPPGEGPHPVLVYSNGSDVAKVASLSNYEEHLLPKGIAFLTVDIPSMGGSMAFDVIDGHTEKLHVAAAQWAKGNSELDAQNVFVQGVSFGGNAAARVWTQHQDLDLAGVIYTCGPLSAVFQAPAAAYDHFPEFTIDGVKTRLRLDTEASSAEFADRARVLSIETVGGFDGGLIDTPLLAVNTNADPVAPLEEMGRLLHRAKNAKRIVFDVPGHCPPRDEREGIVAQWIMENLR